MAAELRRPTVFAAVSGAVVTLLLGLYFAGTAHAGPFDAAVGSWFQSWLGGYPDALDEVGDVGDPNIIVAMVGLVATAFLIDGHPRDAAFTVVGVGLTGAMVTLLKPLFGRTHLGDLAFPSGHTAGVTALALVLAIVLVARATTRRRVVAAVAVPTALTAGVVMGATLVSQAFHYPTDVLGGIGVAVAVVPTVALAFDGPSRVRRRARDW